MESSMATLQNYTKTTMNSLNENTIIVKSGTFFVNRENPRKVSYDFVETSHWKGVQLNTYVNLPPAPTENQIAYVLEGNPYRAAFENIL
jgi:hypothetical protein